MPSIAPPKMHARARTAIASELTGTLHASHSEAGTPYYPLPAVSRVRTQQAETSFACFNATHLLPARRSRHEDHRFDQRRSDTDGQHARRQAVEVGSRDRASEHCDLDLVDVQALRHRDLQGGNDPMLRDGWYIEKTPPRIRVTGTRCYRPRRSGPPMET
jgi:hypothetical protein